ncbi:MAG: DivIVA domain-containing protein [Caldicoprobacterales bacterium]|nr:DivIVA domain-containing protein [Clostridiales bacterium]
MALTPMDIHNKEFSRSFRGYNEDEVDQFLDEIVDEFEKLYKENMELRDKINNLIDQINQYRTMEKTLKDTLVTAQKTADEVTSLAQKKSELIIREAEEQARKIREEASLSVVEANREQFEIRKQIQILKSNVRALLESHIEQIEQLAENTAGAQEGSAEYTPE